MPRKKTNNLYTISALAKVLGISHEALRLRVKNYNLPSNITIIRTDKGKILLKYEKPL